MSWAVRRKTTQIEDMAYSLIGIFGVHMPLLNGEGNPAFIRFQEAIVRTSNDHIIFAWTSPPIALLGHGFEHVSAMLALSPGLSGNSANFKSLSHSEHNEALTPGRQKLDYALTNAGLAIRLPGLKIDEVEGPYAAFLARTEGQDRIPSAFLLGTTAETPAGHFWRTNFNEGPVEPCKRRWFPIPGREAIDLSDISLLLRFTSISGDKIKPSMTRVYIANKQHKNAEIISPRTKKHSFAINSEVLNGLSHVSDSSFRELALLRQAHQMISTNQADQLVHMIKTRLNFPNNIPTPRNRNFYGRAAALQKLRGAFFPSDRDLGSPGRDATSYTISGIWGVGKTQVAVEFSYECIENNLFDAIICIDAESTKTILEGFRRVASQLKLAKQGPPSGITVREVLQWLFDFGQHGNVLSGSSAHSAKWLLVFDNADDDSVLHSFWPSNGPGCVLVKSRDPNSWVGLGSKNIDLELFTAQESSELLSNITGIEGDFTAVSEHLGRLPFAIVQMAGIIVECGFSLEEFTHVWNKEEAGLLDCLYSYRNHEHSLATI